MKHFNKKAVLGFLLAAFLCAQGTGLAPAAEEAGELVSERTEEPELPEEGEGAAEEFVQECTEETDSEEEGITEEAAGEFVQEHTEGAVSEEEGITEEPAGEFVQECTEEIDSEEEGITEEATEEEEEADAGEEKPAEEGEPAAGKEKPAEEEPAAGEEKPAEEGEPAAEEPEAVAETDEVAEETGSPTETGSFTDASGITYDWKACDDGTAEITGFSFTEAEPAIVIPESIGGYPVAALTGSIRNAAIRELVIPETITYLGDNVFTDNEIGVLRYNAADADNAQNFFAAPFAGSRVYELQIGAQVEAIRGYTFYNTEFCGAETVLDAPGIEAYAFCGASFETLVLSDGTAAIGNRAFSEADIHFLSYHCPDAGLQADSTAFGPFYLASIHGLEFSDDVRMIPDYLFSNADMKFSEFSFGQERIGDYAFYGAWDALGFVTGADMAERITIGEGVVSLGKNAFGGCRVGELRYLANAACGAGSTGNGPFYLAEIGRLTVGEAVESIPAYLFANARFTGTQDLNLDVPVGDGAFYSGYEAGASFGELTVGENVELLGKNAFSGRNIESLVYLAEEAKTACARTGEAPFYSCRIGKFVIGEAVTSIDAAAFSGIHLSQEELVIPDSVRTIGGYAFYGMVKDTYEPFETLRVGSGLEELAGTAFAAVSFTDVYVEALGAGKEPDASVGKTQGPDAGKESDVDVGEELDVYPGDLPSAENLFIHRGSDFYSFFSTNAAHVTLCCDDYMVSSEGERCWDEESGRYVQPRYETCSVCGYRNVFYVYEDGTEDKPDSEKKPDPEEEPDPEKKPDSEEKPDPEETRDPEEESDPEKKPDPEEESDPEREEDSGKNPDDKQEVNPEKKPDSENKPDLEETRDPEEQPDPEEQLDPVEPSDLKKESDPDKKEDSGQNPEEKSETEKEPASEKKPDPEEEPVPEERPDPDKKEDTGQLPKSNPKEEPDPEESEPEKTPAPEEKSDPGKKVNSGQTPESNPEKKPKSKDTPEANPKQTPEPDEKPTKKPAPKENPEKEPESDEKSEPEDKPAPKEKQEANPEHKSEDRLPWICVLTVFLLGFCVGQLCVRGRGKDTILILDIRTVYRESIKLLD